MGSSAPEIGLEGMGAAVGPGPMPLAMGVSYRRAPLAVRERLAPADPEAAAVLVSRHLGQGVLLATCNRVEAYTVALSPQEGLERLRALFIAASGSLGEEIEPFLEVYTGEEVVRHLFRVAAGLDSLVLGEAEILGQVGSALRSAAGAGMAGQEMVHLFQHAVRVGRRARVETEVGHKAGSISSAALGLARQALGPLEGRQVLVLGAGEAARTSVRALVGAGISRVLVANRTASRAAELAAALGGQALVWQSIPEALASSDILVTAIAAPGPILTAQDLRTALQGREGRRLVVLDIAVPRNVEPEAAQVPAVVLYNLDGLQAAVEAGHTLRRREVRAVEAIIAKELVRFQTWWRAADALPTIREIHRRAEDLRQRELAKALQRLPSLAPADRAIVDALSRSVVRKLLHDPVASLKDGAGDAAHLAAVRRLFRLREEGVGEPG